MRDPGQRNRAEARRARALTWQPCGPCSYDITTGEGERSCHWYGCAYLPEELDVFCPRCNYDFYTQVGASECGDPPRCNFAREVAPGRVQTVGEWLERRRSRAERS